MQEKLEKARKRLRICLIAVVLLAIVVGCLYYFGDFGKEQDVTEGTLVRETQDMESAIRIKCANSVQNSVAEMSGGFTYGWQ